MNQIFLLIFFTNFFFIYIKISKNSSAKYCQENKEKAFLKKKEEKQQYGRECYKNLSEDEKK